MSDSNQNCPQGLNLTTYSIRSCGRGHSGRENCSSVTFPVDGYQYSHVCGRVTAYRWAYTHAFLGYYISYTIDGPYVSGLSLTHGSPRTHIWTFASGMFSGTSGFDDYSEHLCPCEPGNFYTSPPFVGNDYFCESIVTGGNVFLSGGRFYADNALWDGQDLLNTCYGLNNPPWFYKNLSLPTTDDIEFRMCLINDDRTANIAIELLEVYVA